MASEPSRTPAMRPQPVTFISAPPRRVLFLCVHNSARSQIAEALARLVAPPGAEVWSAGTEPSSVHPLAIEVMAEAGIELSGHRAKRVDEVPWADMDTIVSLCSESAADCPRVGAAVRRVHWPLDDPSLAPEPERLRAFRDTRDELRWRIGSLWPVQE